MITEQQVESALGFWFPGDWPDASGLQSLGEADNFRAQARKEMRDALRVAEAVSEERKVLLYAVRVGAAALRRFQFGHTPREFAEAQADAMESALRFAES